jgi:hypothetical protein
METLKVVAVLAAYILVGTILKEGVFALFPSARGLSVTDFLPVEFILLLLVFGIGAIWAHISAIHHKLHVIEQKLG